MFNLEIDEVEFSLAAGQQSDPRPGLCKSDCKALADATSSTGNEYTLILETRQPASFVSDSGPAFGLPSVLQDGVPRKSSETPCGPALAVGRSPILLGYTDTEKLPFGRTMSKEDCIEVTGTVVEKFPAGQFSVQLDQDRIVLAHLAGKLRRNRIRVLAGDRVTLELSPYDLTKGRITYRHK
jgi:translation initiation factor IF-1